MKRYQGKLGNVKKEIIVDEDKKAGNEQKNQVCLTTCKVMKGQRVSNGY